MKVFEFKSAEISSSDVFDLTGTTVLMKSQNLAAWFLVEKKKSRPSGLSAIEDVNLWALFFRMTCSRKKKVFLWST